MIDFPPSPTVTDAVESRRSVRAFTDQPVDMAVLRDVLAKAQRAASGGNVQPWEVTVLTGAPLKVLCDDVTARAMSGDPGGEEAFPFYPADLPAPWKIQRAMVGHAMYEALGIARDDKAGRAAAMLPNYRAFGAPVLLFVHCRKFMDRPQWADMGIWLGTLVLLLREAGLDSCAQEAWVRYAASIRRAIEVGDDTIIWTGLAIGYRDAAAPLNSFPVPRMDIDAVVQWKGFA